MLKRRMVFNRTASKFLEVLSLILTMIVEIVVKPAMGDFRESDQYICRIQVSSRV